MELQTSLVVGQQAQEGAVAEDKEERMVSAHSQGLEHCYQGENCPYNPLPCTLAGIAVGVVSQELLGDGESAHLLRQGVHVQKCGEPVLQPYRLPVAFITLSVASLPPPCHLPATFLPPFCCVAGSGCPPRARNVDDLHACGCGGDVGRREEDGGKPFGS